MNNELEKLLEEWARARELEYHGQEAESVACTLGVQVRAAIDAAIATEREACAKVCEEWPAAHGDYFAEKIREREVKSLDSMYQNSTVT